MKTRDILTLIGGICLALGPQLVNAAQARWEWHVGTILTSIGGVLVGSRAIGNKNEADKKDDTTK